MLNIPTHLKGRDYIRTQDWSKEDLLTVIKVAEELKYAFKHNEPTPILNNKTIFLMFFDKSTRTRNAFEAGMTQLGGHAHYIDVSTSQISHGESAKDTGIILSRYGHGIAIRHDLVPYEGENYMRDMAFWADKPIINLQSDIDHPTQTIADLMTIMERFGSNLRGLKVAVSWAYTRSYAKPLSVPQGLIMLLTRFGMDVVLARPPEYKLMPEIVEIAKKNAEREGVRFEIVDDMEYAFESADIVYPKSWGALHLFNNPEESLKLAKKYKDWIVDSKKMEITKPHSIYMHCLPAARGEEVTDDVIDGPHSVVFDEAENRLHTAKALMSLLM